MLLAPPRPWYERHALALAAAMFAVGIAVGNLANAAPAAPATINTQLAVGMHPAEVLRVLDGDTFEARMRVWPGLDVTTKVRLRGIDAPEMRARCEDERLKAVAAREALARILAEGAIAVFRVGQDKYGGRVDAEVSTAQTKDVSAALLAGGFARPYDGGKRASWCGQSTRRPRACRPTPSHRARG